MTLTPFLFPLATVIFAVPVSAQALADATERDAQTAPLTPPAAQQSPSASLTDNGFFFPQDCGINLPVEVRQPQSLAQTIFMYRLTLTGEMRDISIVKSSGNSDRDNAAIECAKRIRARPITVAGKPAEVRWAMSFLWQPAPQTSGFAFPARYLFPGDGNGCPSEQMTLWPTWPVGANRPGVAIIAFHLGEDGSAKDRVVLQSSGSPDRDKIALTCAAKLYFDSTAEQNGVQIEIDGYEIFSWARSGS